MEDYYDFMYLQYSSVWSCPHITLSRNSLLRIIPRYYCVVLCLMVESKEVLFDWKHVSTTFVNDCNIAIICCSRSPISTAGCWTNNVCCVWVWVILCFLCTALHSGWMSHGLNLHATLHTHSPDEHVWTPFNPSNISLAWAWIHNKRIIWLRWILKLVYFNWGELVKIFGWKC